MRNRCVKTESALIEKNTGGRERYESVMEFHIAHEMDGENETGNYVMKFMPIGTTLREGRNRGGHQQIPNEDLDDPFDFLHDPHDNREELDLSEVDLDDEEIEASLADRVFSVGATERENSRNDQLRKVKTMAILREKKRRFEFLFYIRGRFFVHLCFAQTLWGA